MKQVQKSKLVRIIASLLSIVILISLCPITSIAEEKDTVKVGVFNLGKFFYYDEDGEPSGYYPDYVEKINDYAHWNVEYVKVDNWKDGVAKLDAGEIDFIAPGQKTEEREEKYLFSAYSMSTEMCAILTLLNRDDIIFDDYKTLSKMHFGAISDSPITESFLTDYASTAGFTPNVTLYDNATVLFEALNNHEVDAVAANIMFANDNNKMVGRFSPKPVYFMSRTDERSEKIMQKLNDAMTELRLDMPTFENDQFNKYFTSFSNVQFTMEEVEYIKSLPEISIGYETGHKPISYTNEKGEFDGVTRDILDRISEISGIKFKYIPLPTTNVSYDYLKDNHIYVISNVEYNDENSKIRNLNLSRTYFSSEKVLIAEEGLEYNLDSSLKVALCTGSSSLEKVISEVYPNFTYETYDSVEKCFDAIKNGTADASLQNRYVAESVLTNMVYSDLEVLPVKAISDNLCIGVMDYQDGTELGELLNRGEFISIMDKCISQIATDEINNSLIQNVAKSRYRTSVLDVLKENKLACMLSLLLLIALISFFVSKQQMEKSKASELAEKNKELAEAVQLADHANKSKSMFLSDMSHDMRTPMNAIIGLSNLAMDMQTVDEMRDYMTKINLSGKQLLALINDTLDVSRIETGKLTMNREYIMSSLMLQEGVASTSVVAEQKGVHFRLEQTDFHNALLYVDAVKITKLFTNLLSNAVKFTPPGGEVVFFIHRLGEENHVAKYCMGVRDTGVGMSKEFLEHIYDPFAQECTDSDINASGTGLGMTIVKSFADFLGAKIEINSELGKGTEIKVYIGYELADKQPEDLRPAEQVAYGDSIRILVAEDHPLNAEIMRKLLEKKGYMVEQACNGKECVSKFVASDKGYYGLILMDIRMPEMTGLEATKVIRHLDRTDAKTIPIVAMTANAFEQDVNESMEAGMNAHLSKPVEPDKLYATLDKFLTEQK